MRGGKRGKVDQRPSAGRGDKKGKKGAERGAATSRCSCGVRTRQRRGGKEKGRGRCISRIEMHFLPYVYVNLRILRGKEEGKKKDG